MKNIISSISTTKAALAVGIAFITSIILVTIVDDYLLANYVVPGDIDALARDIEADKRSFGFATVGYFLVLALDAIIGLALYVVLKPANKNLARLTAVLRLSYVFALIIGILSLAVQFIDVFDYTSIKLVGYVFFAWHIFVLGYSIFKAEYIPDWLGVLLVVASFTYVVFFVDLDLPKTFEIIIMSTMAAAELALSIWLIVKRNSLPEN